MKFTIYLKSFERDLLGEKKDLLQSFLQHVFPNAVVSCVGFPLVNRRFTVLRSPHVNKKSREQFDLRTYKSAIFITFSEKYSEYAPILIYLLKRFDSSGVQIELESQYTTFL